MVDVNTDTDVKMRKYMEILSIIYQQAGRRTDLFTIGTRLKIYNFQNLLTNANVAIKKNGTGLEPELYMEFSCVTRNVAMRSSWDFNDQEKKDLIKKISEGDKIEEIILTMNNMEIAFVFCTICLKTGDYFLT